MSFPSNPVRQRRAVMAVVSYPLSPAANSRLYPFPNLSLGVFDSGLIVFPSCLSHFCFSHSLETSLCLSITDRSLSSFQSDFRSVVIISATDPSINRHRLPRNCQTHTNFLFHIPGHDHPRGKTDLRAHHHPLPLSTTFKDN